MVRIGNALALAAALAVAAGCGKKLDQKAIAEKLEFEWRSCTIVDVTKVDLEANDGKVARFSYVLRMKADGTHVAPGQFPCPQNRVLLIQAMANKDMVAIKRGEEITFIQEIAGKK
jgi:hypothetical protein